MNLKRLGGPLFLCVLYCGSPLRAERVRLPDGTPVAVRLKADLKSDQVAPGERVDFEVARALTVRGLVAIPEGSVAWGAVQSVKKDKEIKLDIVGARLPSLLQIRLRSKREKTANPGKGQIKVETRRAGWVGAPRGTEFMAYLDEDIEVEGLSAQEAAHATPEVAPAPATKPATPAQGPPTPAATTPQTTRQPARPTATPSGVEVTQPATAIPAASQTAQPVTSAVQDLGTVERVTVECFSEPTGAEIIIDGSYYGNTPSILKLTATLHQLQMQMPGYKTSSQTLNLAENRGLRTIRAVLVKKE